MVRRIPASILLALSLALLVACSRPQTPPAPRIAANVLIVTIDTLRADRVGIYGATTVATPAIDRLAREGAWAPQATVHAPLTRPSHVSLFTGRYPAEHGIRDNVSPTLAADVPLLSEILQRAGFTTAAFIASSVLDRQSGLARGFGLYSDRLGPGEDSRSGDAVVAEAIAWLNGRPSAKGANGARSRFYAWVHLYDPHAPYEPPGKYAADYAGRPYDGEVAWSDELVGRLVDALRNAGALDDTLVIVTSDHGEALGDHGEDVHGYFVYEATLRVPLVIRGPGVTPGTRLGGVARTIDLFPTIVEMTGLSGAPPSSGHSLAAALGGGAMSDDPSFAESLVPLLHYGWSDLRAVRDGRWKYILSPKPELYDLERDPGELHNLVDAEAARARALRAGLTTRLKEERTAARKETAAAGISPELLEKLGALGYVSPGGPADSTSKGADPKDKLEEYKAVSTRMQQGLIALRAGRFAEAAGHFQDLQRRGLDSFELHFYLGRAHAGLERWREAAADYDRALAKLPDSIDAWRGLGESRIALGDSAGAARAFEKVVAVAPADALARMQLGEVYRDMHRWQDAAKIMREAIAIDGRPAQYWNALGTVLGGGGQMADAERAFAEAVAREGTNGLYVYNHGLALLQLKRRDEALAEFRRASALGYAPADKLAR